uniref:Sorting nexin 4 n=1 Tax=Xenopus tropicalis TaxID=8364 RepID=A0A803J2H2_XENTR
MSCHKKSISWFNISPRESGEGGAQGKAGPRGKWQRRGPGESGKGGAQGKVGKAGPREKWRRRGPGKSGGGGAQSKSWLCAFRAVCRKHELMQYDLEMSALDLQSKKQQCEELATGTVRTFSLKGMTSKLFGQETPEQREAKMKLLEEQIEEGEEQLKSHNVESREFVRDAWQEVERFKEQKNRDLKEALISYAVMQISMCKKGIQVWSNA